MKVFYAILISCLTVFSGFAQKSEVPTVRTSTDSLILYLDGERDGFNGINKLGRQFEYSFVVPNDSSVLALVSKSDSISMVLKPGKNTAFRIIRETKGDTVICNFSTKKFTKPAAFSDSYKAENQGRSIVQIPEVYELINIVFALTEYGKTGAINKDTDYYKSVIKYFSPYKKHEAVFAIDSLLKFAPGFFYNHLKMDSYAYVFSGDEIVKGGIYDRVGWSEKNELEFYIPLLQTFAETSGFRRFYKKYSHYYTRLKTDYTKNVDVAGMKSWLEDQFPRTKYSAIKIIFSPLAGWNQSANYFNDNGFSEAQAHINFPFIDSENKKASAQVLKGRRSLITFTEINHSYLNPEAERYSKLITVAFGNLAQWTTAGKPSAGYDNALVCFEEYMNYGLVTLLYSDIFDKESFKLLNSRIEDSMVNSRGFQKFKEFNKELLLLYESRKAGQKVADLYPAIIEWASKQKF